MHSKMEEMLLTWRTGSSNGRELFGVVSQVAIERHIWVSGEATPLKAHLVVAMEGQKERLLLASSHDELTKHHVSIL